MSRIACSSSSSRPRARAWRRALTRGLAFALVAGCGAGANEPLSETASDLGTDLNSQVSLPHSLYIADVNGDGIDDFVQLSANKIFVTGTDFGQTGMLHYYLPAPASQLIVGNFSGGGNDQICAVLQNGLLSCYASSSDGTTLWWWFQQGNFIAAGDQVIVGDYDGNGTDDLLVYNPTSGALAAYTVTGGYFQAIPKFSLGNLTAAAKPNMLFRHIRVKGPGGGIATISPNGVLTWYYCVNDGTNNTFWEAFNTASGFVPSGYDITTARIDDDYVDDVVLHSPSGAFSFFHITQSGAGLQPITNVTLGQLDTSDTGAKVYWARMMPTLNEPGGATRDGALVYAPSKNVFDRADARWDGTNYTYWWTYTQFPPAHDTGWPAVDYEKWLVLMCGYSDAPTFPAGETPTFFNQLYGAAGIGGGGMVDYFRDISYGTVDMSANEIHGPYTETYSSSACAGNDGCELSHCIAAATDVNSKNYFRVIAALSRQNGTQEQGGTGGSVPVDTCGEFPGVMGHEMLHSFGLSHGFAPPDANPIQYGDPFDVMSAKASNMFENPTFPGCGTSPAGVGSGPNVSMTYKDRLGWIPSSREWTATSGSNATATVTLAATGRPEANGALVAKINLAGLSGQFVTVEYRIKEGWDQGLARSAVLVHHYDNAPQPGEAYGRSIIEYATDGRHQDLQPNDVFSGDGVLVTVESFNTAAGTATVQIQY